MRAAEQLGRDCGKTLLVLDTVTGGDAERLYARLGWTAIGEDFDAESALRMGLVTQLLPDRDTLLQAARSLASRIAANEETTSSISRFDTPNDRANSCSAGITTPNSSATKKAATAEEVMVATGPKRLSITMLREIDSAELGKLFTRGVEDNSPRSEMSKLIPGLMRMSQIFFDHKKLVAGDSFLIEWIPGAGTVITIKGQPQGEPFKEPEFYNAMMRIWLGPNPADWKLKDALLGKPA